MATVLVVLSLAVAAFFFVAAVGLHRQLQDARQLGAAWKGAALEWKAASDKQATVISIQNAQLDHMHRRAPGAATIH